MLNMSILFRHKQFASKIYNAISMYNFLCQLITDLQNSIHFITGLNHMHKGSVLQKKSEVRFGSGSAKIPGSVVSLCILYTVEYSVYCVVYSIYCILIYYTLHSIHYILQYKVYRGIRPNREFLPNPNRTEPHIQCIVYTV